ncbi:hypothetical protein HYV58_00550 [Candidatus Peregrinibacteria bacterium]|nr:hypothetical protein [Candidatus Peregrinibacteria bacterium]
MRNPRFQEAMQKGVKLDKFIGYFFKGEPDAMRRSYHMVFTLIDGLNLPGIFIQANPHGEHGEMTIVIEFEGLEALGQIIASPVDEDTKRGGVTATLMRISSMFSKRAMDTANEVLSGATAPQVKALQGVNEMVQ